ncbi:hypothetical protein JW879_07855 [candidate division WOR-3 bacterium]|nr:hypothetical protein [candidate division WOR-3 bacterium]
MKKLKYLILLLLSSFILFFPQAVSAGSSVSEYWHNSICLQVYYSNAYIEDIPSIDIDYAYYDPYDEEEGEKEWEEEEEIEIEPETLESKIVWRNKEKRTRKTMVIVGGVMGALTPLIFALEDVQAYGVLLGVVGGGLVGSGGGVLFAEAMIPGEDIEGGNVKAPVGCFFGTFLGTLIGAASGATAGGLMLIGTDSDSPDSFGGPEFGMFAGAIIGGMVGGITGGIAGASIAQSFPSGTEETNIVQKRFPTGRMKTFVRIPDSTGVKRTLVEVPKPPLSMSKIATELIVGAFSGYCIGGISELMLADDPSSLTKNFYWMSGVTLATSIGVYYSGSRNNETGNFLGTFFVSSLGMALSYALLSDKEDRENRSIFLVGSPVVCSIFSTFVFNVARSYTSYQGVDIGFLNFKGDRVILGNPAMYAHSDPFGGKEIAYGLELFKFKF